MHSFFRALVLAVALLLAGFAPAAAVTPVTPDQYYWADNGAQRGPVTLDELKSLARQNIVKGTTMVWTAGMANWARADTIPDVAALLGPVAEWYVAANGQREGPMTLDQLLARIAAGQTGGKDVVWKAGMADWAAAETLPELAAALAPAPIPAPTNMTAATITLDPLGPETTAASLKKSSIVHGAVLGVFLHEMAHALIGELDLAATGPEEDIADEFSAILLGESINPRNMADADATRISWATDVTRYSTLLWYYLDQSSKGRSVPWFDEHSNLARRFRNTLCRIYGADPSTYKDVADKVKLPQDQRNRCAQEAKRQFLTWQRITAHVVRDPGGEDSFPGNVPADTPGRTVTVEFQPSKIGTGEALTPIFRDSGIIDDFAKVFSENFVFTRRDLKITFKDCGVVNAWYDPRQGTVTMCWEVVEAFAGVILDAEKIPRH